MKYTRKPETVEAFRFTNDSEVTGPDWFGDAVKREEIFIDRNLVDGAIRIYGCSIKQGKNWIHAKIGDYIIKDSAGSIFICAKDQFHRQYTKEEVSKMPVKGTRKKGSDKG